MIKRALIILLAGLSLEGFAQRNDASFPRAKIYLENHRIIKASHIRIDKSSIRFTEDSNRKETTVLKDDISLIKVPKGSHVWEGVLIGSGTMGLTALLIDLDTDPLGQPRKKDSGFYLGMVGAGAVAGALIGLLVPKWKPVYLTDQSHSRHLPFELGFYPQGLSLNIKISKII